jgi:methionyl-tRNA formyltransferase
VNLTFPTVVFVGVHTEAEPPLRHLFASGERIVGLVTLAPEFRSGVSGAVDLGPLAAAHDVPVRLVKTVNDPATVAWIRDLRPDLLLVIGWTQLVRDELLSVPAIAALGFHASLLPTYRGRAPINWALIHGETETGNSLIVLAPGADEGDIVTQRRIPIAPDDDCGTLYEKVAATEIEMLADLLPRLRAGAPLPRTPQDSARATVMPKRRPEDGLIDWNRPTARVHDWVRALTHPYPGAFTWRSGSKVLVWKTSIPSGRPLPPPRPAGTLAIDSTGGLIAATADGWIRLERIQQDGGPEVSGADAASILSAGDVFTSSPQGASA